MSDALRKLLSISGPVIAGAVLSYLYFHPGDIYQAYEKTRDVLVVYAGSRGGDSEPLARAVIMLPPQENTDPTDDTLEISEESGWNDTFPYVVWENPPPGGATSWTGEKPGLTELSFPRQGEPSAGEKNVPEKALIGNKYTRGGGDEIGDNDVVLITGEVARTATGTFKEKSDRPRPGGQAQSTVTLKKAISARNLE